MPVGIDVLEVSAALGVVMGRTATRVAEAEALDCVSGYTIGLEVCVPHTSFYRPAIRQRCSDGFLPIGPSIVARCDVADPDKLDLEVRVNGEEKSRLSTSDLLRLSPS